MYKFSCPAASPKPALHQSFLSQDDQYIQPITPVNQAQMQEDNKEFFFSNSLSFNLLRNCKKQELPTCIAPFLLRKVLPGFWLEIILSKEFISTPIYFQWKDSLIGKKMKTQISQTCSTITLSMLKMVWINARSVTLVCLGVFLQASLDQSKQVKIHQTL